MKTQQRKFVVELKSGRRRSAMQPASIWGDTDLKAHAREAEADAPHLFEANMVSTAPSQDGELRPEPRSETPLNDNSETGDDTQVSASSEEAEQTYSPSQGADLMLGSVPQLKEETSGQRSPRVVKRRRKADVIHHADAAKDAAPVRPTTAQVEAPADELVVLDEENRRLKGLLANHLRRENMQLRKMLARFGGI